MDDPALPRLLGQFRGSLSQQKSERAAIRASIGGMIWNVLRS